MKRAEAGSECVLLSEAVKRRMTNRAALPRTEGDSGLWAFSSPTEKQPGEPGHIGPHGKWRHPVGTGRTGLREGSDWTTPQGGTWISWFWKASSDKFQKTIKEMSTITDFPPPLLPPPGTSIGSRVFIHDLGPDSNEVKSLCYSAGSTQGKISIPRSYQSQVPGVYDRAS